MKKVRMIICCLLLALCTTARSQSFEIQQLLLDVEKLAELKNILNDLYQGYEIVSSGYNAIKDISAGNFNLHKVFLDGLLAVSPVVKNYKRVADIVDYQLKIVKEYKAAYNRFKMDEHFSGAEIAYLGKVYNNLFNQSLKNLDELLMVTTASTLRMSDAERLQAIDRIYKDVQDKLMFLRKFNGSVQAVSSERMTMLRDSKVIEHFYGN